MDTFRLALLMLAGAVFFALYVSVVGNGYEGPAAILGAFAGLGVELFTRSGQPAQKRFWQFTTGELLMAMAVAAIGLATSVALWRR